MNPLSPSEVEKAATPPEEIINQILGRINDHLIHCKKHNINDIFINSSLLGEDVVTKNMIIESFKKVGWQITHHSDQKDGEFYKFCSNPIS